MIASVRINVDCLGMPATVEISSVIRTGAHELDEALFHAMAVAVRSFADEVNADQEKILEVVPPGSITEHARDLLEHRLRERAASAGDADGV